MLIKRIYSSVILVALVVIAVLNRWVFNAALTALTVLGLYEFFTMLERKGIPCFKYFGIGMGAVIPLSIMFRFELTRKWELLFIMLALLFLFMMQFKRRQSQGAVVGISTTIFGILYISWFFSFLIRIRLLENGVGLFAAILLITKLGDVGAYLVGARFGKRPLIPRISPKKSVEGAIAGLVFSVLGALVAKPWLSFSYGHMILIGAFGGILGQLGDLSESLMKRDCQVKDSSEIIPGFGGVLDLIDSLLFTAPVFYFYVHIVLGAMEL
ncbi:MAG: phosphatidate cytidylyltransferase [Candidatus Omnitrophica bacterium]|nr:phosphatidate cytidylyltransferase [Candidatus Omnitrophota bacterium]